MNERRVDFKATHLQVHRKSIEAGYGLIYYKWSDRLFQNKRVFNFTVEFNIRDSGLQIEKLGIVILKKTIIVIENYEKNKCLVAERYKCCI